jgi:hypothetical protein
VLAPLSASSTASTNISPLTKRAVLFRKAIVVHQHEAT